jgi:hypothetical protein
MMMEAIHSSETSLLTIAERSYIQEDGIFQQWTQRQYTTKTITYVYSDVCTYVRNIGNPENCVLVFLLRNCPTCGENVFHWRSR